MEDVERYSKMLEKRLHEMGVPEDKIEEIKELSVDRKYLDRVNAFVGDAGNWFRTIVLKAYHSLQGRDTSVLDLMDRAFDRYCNYATCLTQIYKPSSSQF